MSGLVHAGIQDHKDKDMNDDDSSTACAVQRRYRSSEKSEGDEGQAQNLQTKQAHKHKKPTRMESLVEAACREGSRNRKPGPSSVTGQYDREQGWFRNEMMKGKLC